MKLEKDNIKTAILLWILGVVFGKTVGQINVLGQMIGDIIVLAGFGVFILWIVKIVRKQKKS
ncbi:MAG: hypothetical protein UT29_C0003G0064 [Candidatus Yanofskybacteria bacterium GW2011_GWA1_39_13]|uniref:Uncharacterized protein n=1 Tax=Yanofskybacteria sp. (strain GW2011_GWA1_39_13) TaxID=1619019 RepID=A0A0G0MGV0_YANXG|nr:MAG: hypothetical protein UT29_C0003G0064 [Candidatus Yanofskybacteria bacterium GW2011_GWA1_39_13]